MSLILMYMTQVQKIEYICIGNWNVFLLHELRNS